MVQTNINSFTQHLQKINKQKHVDDGTCLAANVALNTKMQNAF